MKLPQEIVLHILSFCDGNTILSLSSCNKEYHQISKDPYLWKIVIERHFPWHNCKTTNYFKEYRSAYVQEQFWKFIPFLRDQIRGQGTLERVYKRYSVKQLLIYRKLFIRFANKLQMRSSSAYRLLLAGQGHYNYVIRYNVNDFWQLCKKEQILIDKFLFN